MQEDASLQRDTSYQKKMEVHVMDKVGIAAVFEKAGLARLKKDLDALARPSIRMVPTEVNESTLQPGVSKLGGLPDLPEGSAWPEKKGQPQSFIAQIRLEDVHAYDVNKVLPERGMLWFFYDAAQDTYGDDPADREGWSVLFAEKATLKRAAAPTKLPAESQFHASALSFATEYTLPQEPQLDIATFDWSDEEQKKYEQVLSTFPSVADHATLHNRLLGNPDTIQDDMRIQCQLTSHGVTDANDPKAKELSKGAMEWQLLLQVDSNEQAGMHWGSSGMLYYWITRTDLHAQQFGTTWLVLQSD
jgi:uncharacterized protein YwqG